MPDDKYTDTGLRGDDPRHGFGDDMGTRIGRPDGAREQSHQAPRDASGGPRPGQVSTNRDAVADGLEGSIDDDAGEGEEQRRVQNASRSDANDVNPDPPAGDDRRIDDL